MRSEQYAERTKRNIRTAFYLYIISPLYKPSIKTVTLNMNMFLTTTYRLNQAEYGIHIRVAASQEYVYLFNTYGTR